MNNTANTVAIDDSQINAIFGNNYNNSLKPAMHPAVQVEARREV